MMQRTSGPTRRGARAASALLGLLVVVGSVVGLVGAGAPAADATAYRFWTYWTKPSGWEFSSVGASRVPSDGSVEGWRFAVSAAASSGKPPRSGVTFDSVCGPTPAAAGSKRVALVVDFGSSADAPPGDSPPAGVATHCAVVAPGANGYAVLADFAALRVESGLVCAVDGYPARGCGEPVADPAPSPASTSDKQPSASPRATGAASSAPTGPGSGAGSGAGSDSPSLQASGGQGGGKDGAAGPTPAAGDPSQLLAGSATTSAAATPLAAGSGPTSGPGTTSGPAGLAVGVGLALALAAAAVVVSRRNRSRT